MILTKVSLKLRTPSFRQKLWPLDKVNFSKIPIKDTDRVEGNTGLGIDIDGCFLPAPQFNVKMLISQTMQISLEPCLLLEIKEY